MAKQQTHGGDQLNVISSYCLHFSYKHQNQLEQKDVQTQSGPVPQHPDTPTNKRRSTVFHVVLSKLVFHKNILHSTEPNSVL